jgi:N-acetyl-alpha-D-glucosaminyl L-malate synthase BshA
VGTELGKELAAIGHEIHFISYSPPIRLKLSDRIHFHEVEVMSYPLFEHPHYELVLATKMAEVSNRYELDVLHVHYAIPHSISALLARQMSERPVPFVTTLHGTDITLVGNNRAYLPITRYGIAESDAVTAVSHYLRDRTVQEFGTHRPIEVIHNFVNCDVFKKAEDPLFRKRFAEPDECLMIHISNFRPVKRAGDVIEMFARLRQKCRGKLLMVGDGPDRPNAEWLAEKCGVAADVHFAGKWDRMDKLLSVSDVLVLPSELESFGLVALEAMASEVPVIATRVGGVPEVVDDGRDAFLFEVGDVEGMADAAVSLFGSEDLRRKMGEAGRAHAKDKFCHEGIVKQYVDLYERTVNA